jgi:hypothetical protein
MPRPLDTRIDRVEGRMAAVAEHGSAAIRPTLRAEAAMGVVIRSALARAAVDAAGATRLCFADEAAAPLVAIPDTAELQCEDANRAPLANAYDRAGEDDFESKILAMARRFAGGQPPDFAHASFAELFAWSLAQPAAAQGFRGKRDVEG